MTDRIRSLHVTLDEDTRTDDAQCIMDAILMVKGVHSVREGCPVTLDTHMSRIQARQEVVHHLIQLLKSQKD